ncbi:nucleotide-binding universal stress UspA family protein [Constrictibacter sp. MBR-5]|jgi:nucleotide-binding universal stress UspA family protein|uniref:universal stress protein n=1 Tax=Constrictibacter sp. MBR-5 TaxID=3156467 RepID=UPI003392646A
MAAPWSLRRILVVVDDSPECAVALRSVARMAERSRATVEALFIEDTAVLHLASLTVVRHVHRHGGTAAPLDVTTIEAMYRSQRLGAQRAVSALTDASGAPCALRVVRGSVSDALLHAAGEADIVVLTLPSFGLERLAGVAERLGGTGLPALLLLRSTAEPRLVLTMADDASDTGRHLIAVATSISNLLGLPLHPVSETPTEVPERDRRLDWTTPLPPLDSLEQLKARGELSASTIVACRHDRLSTHLGPHSAALDARRCPLLIAF